MRLTRRNILVTLAASALSGFPGHAQQAGTGWRSRLVRAARAQIGVTRIYDGAYVRLAYPGGDVDSSRGVCTDVIIRAYRDAFQFDFQKAVHEDMLAEFPAYPDIWGLTRPDRNIDHRRVPNLETFLSRHGEELEVPARARDWQPGDLYTMRLGNLPHMAIISDRRTRSGRPYVIHNIGAGTAEDDIIGIYGNERRFRFTAPMPD